MAQKKVGRKEVPVSSKRVEHIAKLIEREGIKSQAEFADRIGSTQQSISRMMKSKKISEETIERIIEVFPDYRKEWLLGYDVPPTHSEMHTINNRAIELNAPITVLYSAMHEVCVREGIKEPENINVPEFLLLEAQLKDYAVSLMWNYLKHRESSNVWSYLDQIGEANRRNNNG